MGARPSQEFVDRCQFDPQIRQRTLKNIFKGAAMTVVTQLKSDPLYEDYQRLLAAGTKPNLAQLTIARKIAAIALSMWKNKERYDPTKHRKQK